MGYTYRDAGVGYREQEELNRAAVSAAQEAMKGTFDSIGYTRTLSLGGRGVSLHMDGVGTKTLVLERTGALWVAGWDCVAMNVNDLAVAGHRAVALVDYIALPRPMPDTVEEIVGGVARAARETGALLLGGETAVLPGLAAGIDVVCAALGLEEYRPSPVGPGYELVGVESSGLHANGYSLARLIVEERMGGYGARIGESTVGELLSKPTLIYHDLVLEAYRLGLAVAAAHLTGGGWAKLLRILAPGTEAVLEAPEPPPIFRALQEAGNVPLEEMYKVFNMGVGLVLATRPEHAEELVALVERAGLHAYRLGATRQSTTGTKRLLIHVSSDEVLSIT